METENTLRKAIGSSGTSPASVLKRLWPYIKPNLWVVVLAIVTMGVSSATDAGIPALLKPLLDHGFGAKASVSAKWLVPVAVIGLAFVRGALQYGSGSLLS